MKFPIALVLPCLVILLWAVACAGTQQSALAPTLDVEATVQARLTEERAIEATVVAKAQAMAKVIVEATAQAAPTATPIPPTPKSAYSPMLDDYMVGASSIFYRTGFSTAEIRQRQKDRIVQVYDQFASAYVGRACVDRAELNSGEFRSFVAQTVGRETADGTVIGLVAEDLISEMLTRVEGGTETNCMRPFLYPETGAELALAYGLVKAAGLARVNRYLRANTKGGAGFAIPVV